MSDSMYDSSDSDGVIDASRELSVGTKKTTKAKPQIELDYSSGSSDSENDESDDDDVVQMKRKARVGRIESDPESAEEEEEDARVFDARTRYSITGIRPQDLTSDEDSDEEGHTDGEDESEVMETSIFDNLAENLVNLSCREEPTDEARVKETINEMETSYMAENIEESLSDNLGNLSSHEEPIVAQISKYVAEMETSYIGEVQNASDQSTELHSFDADGAGSKAPELLSDSIDHDQSMEQQPEPTATPLREKNSSAYTPRKSINRSIAPSAADQSTELHSFDAEGAGFKVAELLSESFDQDQSMVEQQITPVATPLRKKTAPKAYTPRISFNRSIADKLSSTNNREDIVEILSSDDEEEIVKPKKVQPKITELLKNSEVIDLDSPKKLVSRSFYQQEESRLNTLLSQLGILKSLYETKSSIMIDKGAGLLKKQAVIQAEVAKLRENLAKLAVDEAVDDSARNKVASSFEDKNFNPVPVKPKPEMGWDDLKKLTDQVQPVYTGARGIQTFETQKALTLDRLKDLHVQNQNMPTEDMLHPDPKHLRTSLMPHQRYALSWMKWRERQKPRGGILADDMGLGKTLSMISLVLASNEEGEEKKDESSDSEDDEKENSKWLAKGRSSLPEGGTLIVCPASLTGQWQNEIETRVKRHLLEVLIHHGPKREKKARRLAKYDVVITTYNLISIEHKAGTATAGVKWRRIILDEAHTVRNHKSQASIAVSELQGRYRWVLTGTPIQNKELDMYALLKFLRCSPFDEFTYWKKWIDNKSAGGQARLSALMKTLLLRRTKQLLIENGSLTDIPSKRVDLVEVKLDPEELGVYQRVMLYSQHLFAEYLHQKEAKRDMDYVRVVNAESKAKIAKLHDQFRKQFGNQEIKTHVILVLLLRLRQICCHPGLIDAMLEDSDRSMMDTSTVGNFDLNLVDQLDQIKIGSAEEVVDQDDEEAANKASSKLMMRSNPVFKYDRPSAKIRKCLELLEELIFHTDDKAVVVSQWPSYLNILASFLSQRNVKFCKLTGEVPVNKRNEIVVDFNREKGGSKIMLLSLTAGGVGLNLIGGNHLFLMDLHWNPQLEAQAQDRVYRVGQKKPVVIHKMMCVDTIEQNIKNLQDKKLEIANNVLTGARNNASKLTIADLKSLFDL